jgi:hypothetical protein
VTSISDKRKILSTFRQLQIDQVKHRTEIEFIETLLHIDNNLDWVVVKNISNDKKK